MGRLVLKWATSFKTGQVDNRVVTYTSNGGHILTSRQLTLWACTCCDRSWWCARCSSEWCTYENCMPLTYSFYSRVRNHFCTSEWRNGGFKLATVRWLVQFYLLSSSTAYLQFKCPLSKCFCRNQCNAWTVEDAAYARYVWLCLCFHLGISKVMKVW